MSTVEDAPFGKKLAFTTVRGVMNSWLYVSTSKLFGSATRPDIVKNYPCRPQLHATRIYKPADTPTDGEKLPLFMYLHGGGFVVNNPAKADEIARYIADHAKCLVASLDYSKSPAVRFPTAYEDVVEVALAVINDAELPVDKSKVVIGGDSAGGNLSLACVQDPRLRPHVHGVIGLYPVCDATTFAAEKMPTRPDPSVPDMLQSSYDDLVKMYIGPQQNINLADPRLSPGFFKNRIDLPKHVWLISVEHDLLAAEAKTMAEKLAKAEGGERRLSKQSKQGWQVGGVRWDLVEGLFHGFDQFGYGKGKEALRLEQKEVLYREMVAWFGEVFGR